MVPGKGKTFGTFFYAHGNHVFYGNDEKVVASVAKGERAGAALPRGRRRFLEEADGFFRLRRDAVDPLWQRFLKEEEGQAAKGGDDRRRQLARRLFATLLKSATSGWCCAWTRGWASASSAPSRKTARVPRGTS